MSETVDSVQFDVEPVDSKAYPDLMGLNITSAIEVVSAYIQAFVSEKYYGLVLSKDQVLPMISAEIISRMRDLAFFQGHWAYQVNDNIQFTCDIEGHGTISIGLVPRATIGSEAMKELIKKYDTQKEA